MPLDKKPSTLRIPVTDIVRAIAFIRDFCSNFSEQEIQSILAIVVRVCVISDTPQFAKPEDRQDIDYVFENFAKLINALYTLDTSGFLSFQPF